MAIQYLAASLLAFASLATSAYAKDAEPLVFEPDSQWIGRYEIDHCAFVRKFKRGDETLQLEFRQYAPGRLIDIILVASDLKATGWDLKLRFDPHQTVIEDVSSYKIRSELGQDGIYATTHFAAGIDTETFTEEDLLSWARSVRALHVENAFRKDLRIETGSLEEMRLIMNHCLADLLVEWGLDKDRHIDLQRSAQITNFEQLNARMGRSYPIKALNRGKHGPVRIRVKINRNGIASDCIALASITYDALSERACKTLVKYGEFEPAIDATGVAIDSYYLQSISYFVAR
ncbi:energy transducer TonB [Altererythrobacter sp. MF3-039]|uniref:energy transducer TonB n=1 Tax=Altererythrobacter sp. MF3-039 TaxID=3252901 RepID=UPI00390CCC09